MCVCEGGLAMLSHDPSLNLISLSAKIITLEINIFRSSMQSKSSHDYVLEPWPTLGRGGRGGREGKRERGVLLLLLFHLVLLID